MGAITSSIDENLLKLIVTKLESEIFVETGTFKGDTVAIAKKFFNKVYSIELSNAYYEEAKKRFKNNDELLLIHGDVAKSLKKIVDELHNKKVVYWLDAHRCVARKAAGERSQCTLLEELEAINYLNNESVIIIDDARLFLCMPPKQHEISQWPIFQEVLKHLQKLSPNHYLTIINDTIIFYPPSLHKKLERYAYQFGVDWLNFVDKSRQYDDFLKQLIEKENVINHLLTLCRVKEVMLLTNINKDVEYLKKFS